MARQAEKVFAQTKDDPNDFDKPWEVKKENADRAIKDFEYQEDAWQYARDYAERNATSVQPVQAILKSVDGTIREESTYPRGADPLNIQG